MTPEQIAIVPESAATPSSTSERQSSEWDIRNAPRNYISLAIFQGVSALFSFASVWVITRYLGSEGYGGIVAVIAASQVAQIFVNWTGTAVVRFGVDEFVETAAIARTFWVRLFVLVLNVAIVLSLSQFWFVPLSDWLKLSPDSFWLVVGHFVITAFWIHIQMSLQGAKMMRAQGFLQMLERILILTGFLVLVVSHSLDFTGVVLCYIAAPAAMVMVGVIKLRPLIFSRFSLDRKFVKKIVLYSIPLLPFSLIGYFSGSYVDAIFISAYLSTRDLGVYSVATQMNGIAIQFASLVNALLIPFFVTLDKEGARTKINSYFTNALPNLTLAWGMICTLAALTGYFLIPRIFGVEFAGAAAPFWILLTSSVMAIPILCGYAALTHARSVTYIAAITSALSAIVNIGLNYLLIPRFGMEGCAWATVFAYLLSGVGFAVLLRIKADMPVSWVFLAILPNLCGTLAFSLTNSISVALAVGCGLFIIVLVIKWRSVGEGIDIIKRLVNPSAGANMKLS